MLEWLWRRLPQWGMPCRSLCGHIFHRPHFACLHCRIRRMHNKKIPSRIRVLDYHLLMWIDRPGRRWKGPLLKKLMSVVEFLAN